ncbi:MAG: ribosome maturation factor RimP [Myxococcota bacterium]
MLAVAWDAAPLLPTAGRTRALAISRSFDGEMVRGDVYPVGGVEVVEVQELGESKTAALEAFIVALDPKEELLREVVEPAIVAEQCQLVALQLMQGARRATLRLFVDRQEGDGHIPLATLERINHLLGDLLDVEDEHRGIFRGQYNLEVSSPGLDRPLSKKSHFEANVGKRVKLRTRTKVANARSFTGALNGTNEEGVTLASEGGQNVLIPWREIADAHVVFQ